MVAIGRLLQLLEGQPLALQQQRRPVEVEPPVEHRPFVPDVRRARPVAEVVGHQTPFADLAETR